MELFKNYSLRRMQENDLETILNWRNSDRIHNNMFTDHIISWEEHLSWYEKIKKDPNAIYLIGEYNKKPIGVVDFANIDRGNQKCYWGFYIGNTDAPCGSGKAMLFLALEYIFEVEKIRKLCSEVFLFNSKSINLHKKFGFIIEGTLLQHVLKKSKFEDVVTMALFNHDWQKNKSDLIKQLSSIG